MRSWWRFPPKTREGQFDEKWAFVGKKQKHCDPQDPADWTQGDHWDHVAYDPEHRLVLSVVPGKRSAQHVEQVVQDFQRRTDDQKIELLTSDEYSPYQGAIQKAYGQKILPPRTGKPGRPRHCTWQEHIGHIRGINLCSSDRVIGHRKLHICPVLVPIEALFGDLCPKLTQIGKIYCKDQRPKCGAHLVGAT
jgi:IS1 family transposase